MDEYRIINTDNFGSDYPNESFTEDGPFDNEVDAKLCAIKLNGPYEYASRYFKVVKMPYDLKPGFES